METLFELLAPLNGILGWTSLVFYILVIAVTNMKLMRQTAYLSVINDVAYGLSMGAAGAAKVTINASVAAVNSNRYSRDFLQVGWVIRYAITGLAAIGVGYIVHFGMSDLIKNFTLPGLYLWIDAALVIGALCVKDINKYRAMMLAAVPFAIYGYTHFDQTPMVIIKIIVGSIAAYHLIRSND